MTEPRVPGGRGTELDLPCGETVTPHELDLGLREYACDCGERHAVVMDVHPLSRWVPEELVRTLEAAIETADEFGQFGTPHVMGMVLEEFPEAVVSADVSDDGSVGYAMVWVADFDARRLHEIVVELLVELMEHALSHAEDETAARQFEQEMLQFDVAEFVEAYRAERDFEDEFDQPA
ncbi:DUF5815 family protein [Haloglomus halophilum]|uniref:DUF5815 family protein n=1 Tax=Haloglomus halophilum TaxID=2962672 RepID=UPI0020C98521|nr:DUF5815 family protein [Haloglomus halophilum]